MSGERYVVLGLARVGARWFTDVAHWSTSAALPVEFVKAISVDEARVRLGAGRPYSALLVDEAVAGFDRDLLATAAEHGCAVIVVSSGGPGVGLAEATNLLPREFGRDDLLRTLAQVCAPIDRRVELPHAPEVPTARGQLVAVVGAGGAGTSTVAAGLAQVLAAPAARRDQVCLADLCLVADQGVLHGAPDVTPSVLELTEAHRLGRPNPQEVRSHTWRVDGRGYHLLLGLRRRRDWTSMRSRSFSLALDGLRQAYPLVVADLDDDVDGEQTSGSVDLEERNAMARTALLAADAVLVVGLPDTIGLHHLLQVTRDVLDLGVATRAVLPVVNRSPTGRRARSRLSHAFGELLELSGAPPVASPLHLSSAKGIDAAVRDGCPLPTGWIEPAASTLEAFLRSGLGRSPRRRRRRPVPVRPGELGAWGPDGDLDDAEAAS